jgi:hypothetical protein
MTRKKPTYTEKVHAHRLELMLKRKDLCSCCPAAKGFSGQELSINLWSNWPCRICRSFVGLKPLPGCPCHRLGPEEARRRSIAALATWKEAHHDNS